MAFFIRDIMYSISDLICLAMIENGMEFSDPYRRFTPMLLLFNGGGPITRRLDGAPNLYSGDEVEICKDSIYDRHMFSEFVEKLLDIDPVFTVHFNRWSDDRMRYSIDDYIWFGDIKQLLAMSRFTRLTLGPYIGLIENHEVFVKAIMAADADRRLTVDEYRFLGDTDIEQLNNYLVMSRMNIPDNDA